MPRPSSRDRSRTSGSARSARASRSRRRWWIAGALLVALAAGLAAGVAALQAIGVAPRLLAPYIERRSSGHNPLIEGTGRRVAQLLMWIDRGPVTPRLTLPDWALPPLTPSPSTIDSALRDVTITRADQLGAALESAQPGDVIRFAPGIYRFSARSLAARRAGRADAPITVRAREPGTVVLEFDLLEGFLVDAPHWVFEHLTIVGVCRSDDDCEHAFHVVGDGHHTVIRHNEIREFNAHLKINGHGGRFPDHGQVIGNRLVNTHARRTDAPVTPIDLVAASDWHIEGNLIADFVKDGGDLTSYGAFAKGGGSNNRFVRNVVLCEHRLRGAPGRRVGLSFGGGGTGATVCRDRRCIVEHERGLMRDNLIASCSDEGIYINRGAQTEIVHNTLVDTAGVSVRFAESTAQLSGNLVDGPLRERDGAALRATDNRSTWLVASYLRLGDVRANFVDSLALDLRWSGQPPRRSAASGPPDQQPDLCGARRRANPTYGAFEDLARCATTARN
jgi:nitrous oxidase accessory protein NosD